MVIFWVTCTVIKFNSSILVEFVEEANASGYLTGLPDVTDEGTYRINFQVGDMNGSIANQDFLLHVIIDDYPLGLNRRLTILF